MSRMMSFDFLIQILWYHGRSRLTTSYFRIFSNCDDGGRGGSGGGGSDSDGSDTMQATTTKSAEGKWYEQSYSVFNKKYKKKRKKVKKNKEKNNSILKKFSSLFN